MGGWSCELAFAILVTFDVTREGVWLLRRELEPAPQLSKSGCGLPGTRGDVGAVRGTSDTVDLEWCIVRLARLCLEDSGEDGLDLLIWGPIGPVRDTVDFVVFARSLTKFRAGKD